MKFLNGMWLVREGVSIHRARQVYRVQTGPDSLRLTVPTNWLRSRGDTTNHPVLEVELTSPRRDIIRVRATHHRGVVDHGPNFTLSEEASPDVRIEETEEEIVFTSGDTSAHIRRQGGLQIRYYYRDKLLTSTGDDLTGMAYVEDAQGGEHMREMLNLSVGECVYGLGERFTPWVKNGQTVDLWAEDGGTCSEIAYKNVPLYLTNRGYGVFVNYTGRVSYEIASEVVSKVQFSVPEQTLEYMILGGEDLHAVMQNYTALTGRPALPPAWSFGLWLTTSFQPDYDEETVTGFVDGMAEREIPLHVFHYDCFWMREYQLCDLTFRDDHFPEPKAMLARMKGRGLKICVWINPYISQFSPLFDEGMEADYLLKRPNGDVWQWDMWQPGMALVDFTNPAATAWFQQKLQTLIDLGVDSFKTDFGERIPAQDVVYFDGSDPRRMHNYYTHLYNRAVFQLLEKNFGTGQATLFARSGTAGGQQFPVHWGGDCSATYESMAETLRGGLSLAMSGYAFWSHDISGFENTATPDLYKRWSAFGLLSTHSRLHGGGTYRVPWNFDQESCDVLRHFVRLKCALMPYLYAMSCKARDTGIPVLRPLVMDYPDDPACAPLDRQYLLGDDLLVAPVMCEDGWVDFYLPQGMWTNLLDEEILDGGRWYRRRYDYFHLPLFARQNAVIPLSSQDTQVDCDYLNGITYRLYGFADGGAGSCAVYNTQGQLEETVQVTRKGNTVTVQVEHARADWSATWNGQTAQAPAGTCSLTLQG